MDLDAYAAAHRADWDELARVAKVRRPSGAEVDELVDGYQTVATDLSAIRSVLPESPHADRASRALSFARLRLSGARREPLARAADFFGSSIPAALYRIRWLTLAVTVGFAAVFTAVLLWTMATPGAIAAMGPEDELRDYATSQFAGYYSEFSEASFGARVWTNNAWITAQCIAFGITGLWVPYVLMQNAVGTATSAAVVGEYGDLSHFFLYIAPHGQLELYSIFVAGAAGLRIFWAWVAPGARTRGQALAEDGRALFTVVIALVLSLFVSGVIEGVVTRQDWPWVIKIGIGTVALAAFLAWQWIAGGRAVRAGHGGDLDKNDRGARRLVAG